MRQACLLLTALLCTAGPTQAQVTVDLQALDAVPGAKSAARQPSARKPTPRPRRIAAAKPGKHAPRQVTETPATVPQTATISPPPTATPAPQPEPPPATLPTAPPADVAMVPVAPPPPVAQPATPPAPPISDSATSAATTTGTGLRVTFGAGQAELNPASADAIKNIVQSAPAGDNTSFNVVAYAAGTPEDPSTARRLSLSRALAVRSALMADGVSSSHIYVRALGAAGGDESPDRVDLAVMGGNAPVAARASANVPDAGIKSQSP
ncbi:MAG TPA: OmpA family protein [Acetobacteraceae bacterium]|nr:OmpA family protein [Acetobacteraceae bacterium]